MALADIIAGQRNTSGQTVMDAYYRGRQERRTQETHGLQQQIRQQNIDKGGLQIQAEERKVVREQQQKEIIKNYRGDKKGLVDAFLQTGDLEGASQVVEFASHYDKMTTDQQKEVDRQMPLRSKKILESSDVVLREYDIDPEKGRDAYAEEFNQMQRDPQTKQVAARMPDPRTASDEEIVTYSRKQRNRSLTYQKFDEDKRHRRAQEAAALARANKSGSNSEYITLRRKEAAGQADSMDLHRIGVLAGKVGRAPTKGTQKRFETKLEVKLAKEKRADTDKLTKSADDKIAPFSEVSNNIDKAIAAMDSGDTSVSDRMVTQVIAQITNPNVRAFQMYKEFNTSFGNAIQRIVNSVQTWATGKRTPEEKAVIRDTLKKFKNDYSDPGIKYMSKKYRATATDKGLRPWEVVPPRNLQEVLEATDISDERKVDLWEKYFPGEQP